jgi:hypothetical protein
MVGTGEVYHYLSSQVQQLYWGDFVYDVLQLSTGRRRGSEMRWG